jgi:hypothetical protein
MGSSWSVYQSASIRWRWWHHSRPGTSRPSIEACWGDLGEVSLNDKLNGLTLRGLDSELAGVHLGDIVARRDQLLLGLLKLSLSASAAAVA